MLAHLCGTDSCHSGLAALEVSMTYSNTTSRSYEALHPTTQTLPTLGNLEPMGSQSGISERFRV